MREIKIYFERLAYALIGKPVPQQSHVEPPLYTKDGWSYYKGVRQNEIYNYESVAFEPEQRIRNLVQHSIGKPINLIRP